MWTETVLTEDSAGTTSADTAGGAGTTCRPRYQTDHLQGPPAGLATKLNYILSIGRERFRLTININYQIPNIRLFNKLYNDIMSNNNMFMLLVENRGGESWTRSVSTRFYIQSRSRSEVAVIIS